MSYDVHLVPPRLVRSGIEKVQDFADQVAQATGKAVTFVNSETGEEIHGSTTPTGSTRGGAGDGSAGSGTAVTVGTVTDDLAPLVTRALGHDVPDLNELIAGDHTDRLQEAASAMAATIGDYMAMDPPGGIRDCFAALSLVRRLAEVAAENPTYRIVVY